MTSFNEIVAFVKAQGRISSSDQDSLLATQINLSFENMCRKASVLGWAGLRVAATITTTSDQDYDLPSTFDKLIEQSVKYYTTVPSDGVSLDIVSGSDAELWESMAAGSRPYACRVIAGSNGRQRSLRLMPDFSETGKTVGYSYYRRPAILSGSATLELPELAQAVAWDVLSIQKSYGRDEDQSSLMYLQRAKASFRDAMGTLL